MNHEAVIISDIHLTPGSDNKIQALESFLESLKHRKTLTHLIIAGDLFDIWIGKSWTGPRRFKNIISLISALQSRHIHITYIEGNHDFNLSAYFSARLGWHVHDREAELSINNRRIYIAHGDTINTRDSGYLLLRKVTRSIFFKLLISVLPSFIPDFLGGLFSHKSRKFTDSRKENSAPFSDDATRELFRQFSMEKFKQGYDSVFLGHTHIMDELTMDGKQYLNPGAWTRDEKRCILFNQNGATVQDIERMPE